MIDQEPPLRTRDRRYRHARTTMLLWVASLLVASSVGRAQTVNTVKSLPECLALSEEDEIRSCTSSYTQKTCVTTPNTQRFNLMACVQAATHGSTSGEGDAVAMSKCSQEASTYETAQRDAAKDFQAKCTEEVRAKVSARLTADRSCKQSGTASACFTLPYGNEAKACLSQCLTSRESDMNVAASQEQAACEARYIEAGGRGKFACSIPGADKNIDTTKLKGDVDPALQSLQSVNAPTLDDAIKLSEGQFLDTLQTDCTKACNERAPNFIAVEKQGQALVVAYKRCMVSADSTSEARKLSAYESDLYCDYLRKADTECRTSSRCDWLEQYSELTCTYASPGVNCQ